MKNIKIGKKVIKNFGKPYIIAEACINHQGNLDLAMEMIHVCKNAGCDAVKFQIHVLEDEMLMETPISKNFGEKSLYEALDSTNLSIEELKKLKTLSENLNIDFLCTPFSFKSCDQLVNEIGVEVIKVGSGEFTNLPLQKHIASKKKPMIISSGMSEMFEVEETYKLLNQLQVPFALMHCVSAYPCPYEIMNLGLIKKYIDLFNIPIGLSDHTPTIYTSLAAVSHGACIIEKHFTLDKTMEGPDHKSSINPSELKELVDGCNAINKAMGSKKIINDEEKEILLWARESVVSTKNIKVGDHFSNLNISVKRPSPGNNVVPAKSLDQVLGQKSSSNIKVNKQIKWSDIL